MVWPVSLVAHDLAIHDLQTEILYRIFDHLEICDVGRCTMVNRVCITKTIISTKEIILQVSKRWNYVGSGLIIKELICEERDDRIEGNWCTEELFERKMLVSSLHLSKTLSLNTKFLKRQESKKFQLIHLNRFVHLEHLELNHFEKESQNDTTFLNLPNFKIVYCRVVNCKLVFNTPILPDVYMSGSKDVRLRNLPTLKLLERIPYIRCVGSLHTMRFFRMAMNIFKWVFNRIKSVEVSRISYSRNLHAKLANDVKEIRFVSRMFINSKKYDIFLYYICEEIRKQNKMNVKIFDILMVSFMNMDLKMSLRFY